MLNIELIRNDLKKVKEKLLHRNYNVEQLDIIIKKDIELRKLKTNLQNLNEERNKKSAMISELIKQNKKNEVENVKNEVSLMKNEIESLEARINLLSSDLNNLLLEIPNIYDDSVPIGKDENDNLEIKKWGVPRNFDFEALPHWELGKKKKLFLTDEATKITGSRFVIYYGDGAKLYRALQQYTLDKNIKNGFIEVCPPTIINYASLYGTGQLPKFKEDVFKIENSNYYLSPTAEVQLTNIYRNNILDNLPIKFTANTVCYRSEAGSASRDTRGVIRLHQFTKSELVVLCENNESFNELEKITTQAESILESLKLPYRRILLCSGDMGFSSTKTYDIEVWLPSYNAYKEISSCSNCLDFQARRSMIRYKNINTGKNEYVHTLNGSSLAIDRLWVAVVENYQNSDGSITIPEVLIPYMNVNKI